MKTNNCFCTRILAVFLVSATATAIAHGNEREIPPAFGPFVNLTARDFSESGTFTAKDRIVGTYFFYWYDVYTKNHIVNADGTDTLTDAQSTALEDFSYKSVRWHESSWPTWKRPASMWHSWCSGVLRRSMIPRSRFPLELRRPKTAHCGAQGITPRGLKPPMIGLFYDTSTLQANRWGYHADLTTDYGKRFVYGTVRDFFSCIPPKHWAMIDGKPIVLLYASAFAKKWDRAFWSISKRSFQKNMWDGHRGFRAGFVRAPGR